MDFQEVKLDGCIAFGSLAKTIDASIMSSLCKESQDDPESIIFPSVCIRKTGLIFYGGKLDSKTLEVFPQCKSKSSRCEAVCPPGSLAVTSSSWYSKIKGRWECSGWNKTSILCLGMRSWLAGGSCVGLSKVRLVVDSDPLIEPEDELQSLCNKLLMCQGVLPPEIGCYLSTKISSGYNHDVLLQVSNVLRSKIPGILADRLDSSGVFQHSFHKMKKVWGMEL